MTLRRITAAALGFAMFATACSTAGQIADDLDDVASEIADGLPDGSDGDAGGAAGEGGEADATTDGSTADAGAAGDGSAGGGSDGDAGTDGAQGAERVPTNDLGPVGANGKPMLQGSYPTLVIEVDVQSCTSADQGALDHMVSVLRSVVDKPGGIVFRGGNSFDSERREWTSADLRNSAAEHRSTRSAGDEVSLYVQYVCGSFFAGGQQSSAIGVAYNGSEFAVFPQRWNDGIGVLLGSNRAVERAVLVHEAGHLFGLVNLTYDSDIDHEDPDHPGHSNSRSSAMFWAIESTAIGQVFSGPPPDTFDDADRADLDGLKSGRY